MFDERPPVRKLVPSWNLQDVLDLLTRDPYEPAGRASLLHLSIKTAFLLAAATARRSSEIHALTLEPGHMRWEPGGVRMTPTASFLTKNQGATFNPPDIFVPEIGSSSSIASDKLWCPVRALKFYLARTKPLRGDCKQLFITAVHPHGPASRDTIARWVVSAIKFANSDWPSKRDTPVQGLVRAHDVRAVTTSWAFFRGSRWRKFLRQHAGRHLPPLLHATYVMSYSLGDELGRLC